jgi:hypothetical protein
VAKLERLGRVLHAELSAPSRHRYLPGRTPFMVEPLAPGSVAGPPVQGPPGPGVVRAPQPRHERRSHEPITILATAPGSRAGSGAASRPPGPEASRGSARGRRRRRSVPRPGPGRARPAPPCHVVHVDEGEDRRSATHQRNLPGPDGGVVLVEEPSVAYAGPGPYKWPRRNTSPPAARVRDSSSCSAASTGANGFGGHALRVRCGRDRRQHVHHRFPGRPAYRRGDRGRKCGGPPPRWA